MTQTNSLGRSIRLFLVDGTPTGIITAEIVSSWTGKALAAPRSKLPDLIHREEAERTGVYILIGSDPNRLGGLKAYIGEADAVGRRLRDHDDDEDKDFFERVMFVVSKDENLTKAHARFLESQLIRAVREAGSVRLSNSTDPGFSRLPESDRADMAFFVEQIRIVLPILGFDLFRPSGGQALASANQPTESPIFEFSAAGAQATAREAGESFVVLAGSTARKDGTSSFPESYRLLRDQLVKDGKLVESDVPTHWRFADDIAFTSPSTASSIVAARSQNGPGFWKVRGTGQTYKMWRAARLS